MSITNLEKETIVSFNEAESTAEIYTHNIKLINKIMKMQASHPEEYQVKVNPQDGGVTCVLPKMRLSINFLTPLSEEASRKASERVQQIRPWENSPKYKKRANAIRLE